MKKLSDCTILLVDDSPENLMVLEFLLENTCRIHTESNGTKALARAAELQPDLILLDVVMPGVDGFGLCRALKSDPRTANTPVIFITSLSDTDDKLEGFGAGGVDYITKPFDRSEVRARVCSHLKLAMFEYEQRHRIGVLSGTVRGMEEMQQFMESEMAEIFLHADDDWKIQSINRRWRDLTGENVAFGSPLWDIAEGHDSEMLQQQLLSACERGAHHCSVNFQAKNRENHHVAIKGSFRFIRDDSHQLLGVIGLLTDVSDITREKTHLEEQLATDRSAASARLAHLEQLAHEVRTPMNMAQAGLTELRELRLPQDAESALFHVEQGVTAISSLMERLLSEDVRNAQAFSGIFHFSGTGAEISETAALVVDDIDTNRLLLTKILKKLGFPSVDCASSGEEALQLWDRHRHRLVLLDYMMDGIDGYETCQRLRTASDGQPLTVIGISASALPENLDHAKEAGFCAQLPKPVSLAIIRESLKSLGWNFLHEPGSAPATRDGFA